METKRTATRIPLTDIVALYKAGLTPPDISLCTGVKLRTVQRWVKRYKENGGEEISDIRVYCGRKRVCLSQVLEEIQRQLLSNPRATARQLQNSNPDILGGLSLRTIQRWIREDMGLMRNAGWKWKTFDDIGTPKMNAVREVYPSITQETYNNIAVNDTFLNRVFRHSRTAVFIDVVFAETA